MRYNEATLAVNLLNCRRFKRTPCHIFNNVVRDNNTVNPPFS
ncbi:hypothetical protein HMPREF0783_1013 [Staphylococcus aureus subsp. aureus ATCC BAA-39]|nr:hypothetical protein HMPREF0783_1013 [Staphylococcus aureus subsp. aureus ATCC BAA-39]